MLKPSVNCICVDDEVIEKSRESSEEDYTCPNDKSSSDTRQQSIIKIEEPDEEVS